MNKLFKGGIFLIALVLMVFAILTLITGGMGALGITLFAALGIGSALVVGTTGWDGVKFILAYFKSDEKKAPQGGSLNTAKSSPGNIEDAIVI